MVHYEELYQNLSLSGAYALEKFNLKIEDWFKNHSYLFDGEAFIQEWFYATL
jgi:hypothetical protein